MGDADQTSNIEDELQGLRPRATYTLTRRMIVRGIGFIYFVAFASLSVQVLPLLGSDGLLPVQAQLNWLAEATRGSAGGFIELPSVFWLSASDVALQMVALLGTALSLSVLLGYGNVPILLGLWSLYLSVVHVGQIFYGYGWEYLLLEAGLLTAFLVPLWCPGPGRKGEPGRLPTLIILILLRWLTFRLMFGAGLIKIRGDECWTELTCLVSHYETQPNPHPLSWVLHQMPVWFHKAGVLFNHFVELIVPFFVFGPRKARLVAGGLIVAFQTSLILSGNLSFLNWLTIVIALSCFDDEAFSFLRSRVRDALRFTRSKRPSSPAPSASRVPLPTSRTRLVITILWALVVTALSLDPLENLLSIRQRMNASYNRLHLVNSYGAFGTIHRVRHEVILEGTPDELGPNTKWKAYEFPCKPGATGRAPCLVTPYHHRLQWQFWFASFSGPDQQAWLPHLAYKLLWGRDSVKRLVEHDPFPDGPPKYIRARLFEYRFTSWGKKGWWERVPVGQWMRPMRRDDPELVRFIGARGFPIYSSPAN